LVEYSNGKRALFYNLIGIVGLAEDKNFAEQGDSGAIILDDDNAAAGQIISVASGMDLTLATPIGPILERFQVDPV